MTDSMLPYDDPEWQDVPEARRVRFERMVEAIRTHRAGLLRIFAIGEGFIDVQHEAMRRSNSNQPSGRRYAEMYDHVLDKLLPELKAEHINKTTRGHYVWCAEHRDAIERWWSAKPQKQRDRWNNPDAVRTNFVKDNPPESTAAPQEKQPDASRDTPAARQMSAIEQDLRDRIGEGDKAADVARVLLEYPEFIQKQVHDILAKSLGLIEAGRRSGRTRGEQEAAETVKAIAAGKPARKAGRARG